MKIEKHADAGERYRVTEMADGKIGVGLEQGLLVATLKEKSHSYKVFMSPAEISEIFRFITTLSNYQSAIKWEVIGEKKPSEIES